jgi:hypothetical protein
MDARQLREAVARGVSITRVTLVWRVLPPGAPTLANLSYDPQLLLRQRRLEGLDAAATVADVIVEPAGRP